MNKIGLVFGSFLVVNRLPSNTRNIRWQIVCQICSYKRVGYSCDLTSTLTCRKCKTNAKNLVKQLSKERKKLNKLKLKLSKKTKIYKGYSSLAEYGA